MNEFRCEATRVLQELKPNSQFLTVHNYTNNYNEVSDFSIVFHINYINAVKRSLDKLQGMLTDCSHTVSLQAKNELIESFRMTLAGSNPKYCCANTYSKVSYEQIPVCGIKLHDRQDILHLVGFRVHKRIIVPGTYPQDNRSEKIKIKDMLREQLPVGQFGQFKLTPGRFSRLVVAGMTINERDVLRTI